MVAYGVGTIVWRRLKGMRSDVVELMVVRIELLIGIALVKVGKGEVHQRVLVHRVAEMHNCRCVMRLMVVWHEGTAMMMMGRQKMRIVGIVLHVLHPTAHGIVLALQKRVGPGTRLVFLVAHLNVVRVRWRTGAAGVIITTRQTAVVERRHRCATTVAALSLHCFTAGVVVEIIVTTARMMRRSRRRMHQLPFAPRLAGLAEALGERIVVDL